MGSYEGRRSFLLGITLNELSFIMFFLLMIISTVTLQKTNNKLEQEIQQKAKLQTEIVKARQDRALTFKRLQLLESRLMRAGGFPAKPSEQQLDEMFAKMREVKTEDHLQQTNARLLSELESLQRYKRLEVALEGTDLLEDTPLVVVEQLLQQVEKYQQQQQLLKGRVAYMQKKLNGNGLDHPPCWADPQSGAVEYLYKITLYQQRMLIEAAWPEHRKDDLRLIPGAENLAGQSITMQQLKQRVKPVFAWSKAHECRHFIRIKDDKHTSKKAFKQQMLAIETYFYKYLER